MKTVALALASVVAVSLVSLAGLATLGWNEKRVRRVALAFVAFAVGALLGDVFIHHLPEAFAGTRNPLHHSLLVLGGFLAFFVLERLLRRGWPHRYVFHHHHHDAVATVLTPQPVIAINLLGDAMHNFVDGMLIGASYLVSVPLGVSTTLAVLLHEIPQELGDFGILVHGGLTVRRAVLLNLLSALVALVGAALALVAGAAMKRFSITLVPLTAGGFLYLAAADLVPELQHQPTSLGSLFAQVALIGAGIGVMVLLTLLG